MITEKEFICLMMDEPSLVYVINVSKWDKKYNTFSNRELTYLKYGTLNKYKEKPNRVFNIRGIDYKNTTYHAYIIPKSSEEPKIFIFDQCIESETLVEPALKLFLNGGNSLEESFKLTQSYIRL